MAGPFAGRYRAIVEVLFSRRLTAADGIPLPDACRGGYDVPEALRDFYAVVGRFDRVLTAHNRFYSPDGFRGVDGKVVFCEENQVVVLWGYDKEEGRQADPPVYQGVNNDEIEWYLEAGRCSDFLAGMIYWQALNGGLPEVEFRYRVSEGVRRAAEAWPLVWQDADSHLFSRGSAVFSITRTSGGVEVQAAGASAAELDGVWLSLGLAAGPS